MTHRCIDCGSFNTHEVAEDKDPGKFVGGKAPYGFGVKEGRYVFDESIPGQVTVSMMTQHAHGCPLRDIALWANANEFKSPSGGEWDHSAVWRVVDQGKRLAHLIPIGFVLR